MMMRALWIALIAVDLAARVASADCVPRWLGGERFSAPDVSGDDLGIARFDDGTGPQVYLAGDVQALNEPNEPKYLIRWDGGRWRGVPSPLTSKAWDCALYQGRLLVSGGFSMPGLSGQGIAAYDSTGWTPFAATNGPVYELMAEGDSLTIGGDFTFVDGVAAVRVATWSGTGWSNYWPGFAAPVRVLARWNNALIAGVAAQPGYVSRWTGTAWQTIGVLDRGRPMSATVLDGRLIVGGDFTAINGVGAVALAGFDGIAWSDLGGGLTPHPYSFASVAALVDDQSQLIVAGSFATAGGQVARSIAWWDGDSWGTFGDGLSEGSSPVLGVLADEEGLVVAGPMARRIRPGSQIVVSAHAARWDTQSGVWRLLRAGFFPEQPTADTVRAFAPGPAQLDLGGDFVLVADTFSPGIGAWDGLRLSGPSSGLFRTAYWGRVNAIVRAGDSVFAGGAIEFAGEVPTAGIARWDGTQWHALANGYNGVVTAMALHEGKLVVGADQYVDPTLARPAVWDGVQWTSLEDGVPDLNAGILALTHFNGELIAAGYSRESPVSAAVYRFDGANWVRLGSAVGTPGQCRANALAVHSGELYAGGAFSFGDDSWGNVARWDGVDWQPLGEGTNGEVFALASYRGELYAGGNFYYAGAVQSPGLARWNGGDWASLEPNLPFLTWMLSPVYALSVFDGELCVGSSFRDTPRRQAAFGRWACPACAADTNCDGVVDFFDVDPLVLALTGQAAYSAEFPECRWRNADCDGDDDVDFFDIDPFIALLGATCP